MTEHSEENLAFWLEVESYKLTTSEEKLQRKATEIYNKYLRTGARNEINGWYQK